MHFARHRQRWKRLRDVRSRTSPRHGAAEPWATQAVLLRVQSTMRHFARPRPFFQQRCAEIPSLPIEIDDLHVAGTADRIFPPFAMGSPGSGGAGGACGGQTAPRMCSPRSGWFTAIGRTVCFAPALRRFRPPWSCPVGSRHLSRRRLGYRGRQANGGRQANSDGWLKLDVPPFSADVALAIRRRRQAPESEHEFDRRQRPGAAGPFDWYAVAVLVDGIDAEYWRSGR
jgi:hypothetical protein